MAKKKGSGAGTAKEQASEYLRKAPKYLAQHGNDGKVFFAAMEACYWGYGLDDNDCLDLMAAVYAPRCEGEYSKCKPENFETLLRKVKGKDRNKNSPPRGHRLKGEARREFESHTATSVSPATIAPSTSPAVGQSKTKGASTRNEADDDPDRIARFALGHFKSKDDPGTVGIWDADELALWNDDFYRWSKSHWKVVQRKAWESKVNEFTRQHFEIQYDREDREYEALKKAGELDDSAKPPVMQKVKRGLVQDVIAVTERKTILRGVDSAPAWIRGAKGPAPAELVPARNGLVHLPSLAAGKPDSILRSTPGYFNLNALEFDVDPNAPAPVEWHKFMANVWPNDSESVALLQEWFGYLICQDVSQQKALLLIGPPRAGKGVIGKVLESLIGPSNSCAPSLGSLADRFGLAPLLGKSLAIMGDVRVSSRADQAAICDRVLTITGHGPVEVERKNRDSIMATLAVRFVMCTNEAPRLADSSGAFASRLCVLQLSKSHLGSEDTGLADRLLKELPGIFLWAVQGWKRLRQQGRFTEPKTAADMRQVIADLGSPVKAFIRERCDLGEGFQVDRSELYAAWRCYCDDEGRKDSGTASTFGKDLRAAMPGIREKKCGSDREGRVWRYLGIRIKSLYDSDPFASSVQGESRDLTSAALIESTDVISE